MTEPSHTLRTARPWHLGRRNSDLGALPGRRHPYRTWQFAPDGVAYFTGYPLAMWTINVVGGLVAACLLLALSRWSVLAAVACAAAQAVLLVVTFGFRGPLGGARCRDVVARPRYRRRHRADRLVLLADAVPGLLR